MEPCKYYASGQCRNGAQCRFAHAERELISSMSALSMASASALTSNAAPRAGSGETCKYYSRGTCSYGDRCRYAHVNANGNGETVTKDLGGMNARAEAYAPFARGGRWRGERAGDANGARGAYGEDPFDDEDEDEEWGYVDEYGNWVSFDDEGAEAREFLAAQLPDEDELLGLTSVGPNQDDQWGYFDQAGNWVSFDDGVGQYLNESNAVDEAQEFFDDEFDATPLASEDVAGDDASAGVECAVCLEVVMNAPKIADRRFGLLNNCEHAFCLACIRNWREGGTQRGAEASASSNELSRACPICRVQSHFITPATMWPRNGEEKSRVIDAYRERLSKIPCRHFDRGDGHCPFGSSCFYEHRYANGELATLEIRKSTAADGSLNILTPVRLSDFLTQSRRFR